jgi:plastocyanin
MKYLRTIPLLLAVLTAAALFVACGGDDEDEGEGDEAEAATRAASSPTDGADGAGGEPIELELVAENTSYDPTELTATAGAEVTIVFDNDDPDVQHNFALFENEESAEALFSGEIITGVETTDYEFTAPEDPGTYHYHCEVHPTQMTGDFIVE